MKGGFERLRVSWALRVFFWVKDLMCFYLLGVMRDDISQWIVWFR